MASMPSTSEATSSSSSTTQEVRPQAGPLPRKQGEIGYTESLHAQAEERRVQSVTPLPERHPADRDAPPSADPSSSDSTSIPIADSSSTGSISKKQRLLGIFKSKNVPSFGGLRLTTLGAFALQLALIGATVAGWIVTTQRLSRSPSSSNGTGPPVVASNTVFIHVVFALAILAQLVFIERRVYRLRAERYSYLHPGEMLPSFRNRNLPSDPAIAFSPWNRPPLPTYAAALAQSGAGTGDVEDHIIAAPPPPAYGNTRGSTLLLSGYLRNSLRAQRPISVHSQSSQQERPTSYASRDSTHEVQTEDRARRLEQTLARLERPTSRT